MSPKRGGLHKRAVLSEADRQRFDELFALNMNNLIQVRDFARDDVIGPSAREIAKHNNHSSIPSARDKGSALDTKPSPRR